MAGESEGNRRRDWTWAGELSTLSCVLSDARSDALRNEAFRPSRADSMAVSWVRSIEIGPFCH